MKPTTAMLCTLHPAYLVTVLALACACASAVAAEHSRPSGSASLVSPDVQGLVDKAHVLAQSRISDAMLLAFDDTLPGMPATMAFFANEFGGPREIVKNAPYSAEAITETIQVLPDGNRIVRKSVTLLARDGVGRTRVERKGDGGQVYIHDPIDGRSVVLNESRRTATRIPRMPLPPEPPATGAPGSPGLPAVPGVQGKDVEIQPARVVVRRNRTGGEAGAGAERDEMHIEVIRIGRDEDGTSLRPPMPPLALPMLPRGKGETKSLGTRTIDGVKADGTQTTHTIAAGAIGNEKPIITTTERWFSPELHVVVMAKTTDPRSGETIYRLANVKRTEPPAGFFKVPADYTTRGESRRG